MPAQERQLPFPMGGLSTRRGYQSGDVQTTRGASNVVPDDSHESRTRGGSRPGLTKRYSTGIGAIPSYMLRVSGGDDTRAYEFLVVGTAENAYIGQSVANGEIVPISYAEQLGALSGELCLENGEILTTEDDTDILVNDFTVFSIDQSEIVSYRGTVLFGSPVETIASGASGTIAVVSSNGVLDDSGVADWTVYDLDPAIDVVEITGVAADITSGTYKIGSVVAGAVTLVGNPVVSGSGPEDASYVIRRGIRQLDPIGNTFDLITYTAGIAPSGVDAAAVFRDRVVWAVGRNWLMSRQGDPGDYDYGADPEDPSRAFAGNIGEAGQPGDPIVALVPSGFDYLIMFGENSISSLRGDPGYGGQLYPVSTNVGCVGSRAWCYGESTEIYFLAKDGLYLLPPNAAGVPQPLSPVNLPRELRGVDRDNNHISLAYDMEDRGVLILITPRLGTVGQHWWFDLATKSFWPISFMNNSHQPIRAVTFGGSPQRVRRIVFACIDGFLREWVGSSDDGTSISSNVILGPYELAEGDDSDGILTKIRSVLDEQSGDVTAELYVGATSEEASAAAIAGTSPRDSRVLTSGRSNAWRPRVRGTAFCVRLVSTSEWSFEAVSAMIAAAGRIRN